jgi:uncharacterized membrane protein
MELMVAGLAVFLGMHGFTRVQGLRAALVGRIGANGYKGLYSLVSLAGFVMLVMGYGAYRAAGQIAVWTPPVALMHVAWLLTWPAMILLVASYAPRGAIKAAVLHPQLLSVKVWAVAHLLANGDLGSMILFAGFLAWAIYARVGQPKEPRETLPFGRGDWIALAAGTALWAGFLVGLHRILIGVPLMGA